MSVDPRRYKQLQQLIQKLGLSDAAPVQWQLLDLALTHPTLSPEANYERLEFVGDAVIRLAAAEFLFEMYPDADEGELAAIRSALVSDRILSQIAESYGLDRYLLMSAHTSNDKVGRETRLAAAFEALLAALYLSTHTLDLVRPWLSGHLQHMTDVIRRDPTLQNYKGALQAWTQAHHQTLPEYRVTEVGQAYGDAERFVAEVWLGGRQLGQGKGQSKKAAEQAAAKVAFLTLQKVV
ncbi:ribonuclease III [Oscillatoria sp. FACHB-1407]|uniref:ribonuclease III n=1 Tax=Oscillatoria sp. FACHB-1407 TaxID=2692847 RepID=UPI0016851197|nr:ribonuclease III [Oscillatoria sp. FACHB-1407]MBD2464003.1 ribonuclease III [Oscillatoria sp. FACHB-1407]